jgi:hypothetical protein
MDRAATLGHKSGMREILETISTAQSQALCDAAAEHFGITRDPVECGYVLPDGRMLDLSGRHAMLGGDYRRAPNGTNVPHRGKDWQAGVRHTDHRELDFFDGMGGTDGMLRFMEQSGAVRVMPPIGFTLMSMPTKRQIATMVVMARHFDPEVYVEVYNANGDTTVHKAYDRLSVPALVKFLHGVAF